LLLLIDPVLLSCGLTGIAERDIEIGISWITPSSTPRITLWGQGEWT